MPKAIPVAGPCCQVRYVLTQKPRARAHPGILRTEHLHQQKAGTLQSLIHHKHPIDRLQMVEALRPKPAHPAGLEKGKSRFAY